MQVVQDGGGMRQEVRELFERTSSTSTVEVLPLWTVALMREVEDWEMAYYDRSASHSGCIAFTQCLYEDT
jgi:hypothetical protein